MPQILDVICRTTGMGFAAIARVTKERWVTCSAKDDIAFGLKPGDELQVETTICNEIRETNTEVAIDHVEEHPHFSTHHTPLKYGFQSYISVPIYRKDKSFFGTLCAIDPKPAKVNTPEVIGMFKLFADLISFHLQALQEMNTTAEELVEERRNSELRDQFIAILGHDLRSPIATTSLSADMLMQLSKEEKIHRHAKMIKSTSYRMSGLIENILDFARGRLGEGISLNFDQNNDRLQKNLDQVVMEIKAIAPQRQIEIKYQLDYPVSCDNNRISQMFANLLGNADTHGAEDAPIYVEVISNKEGFSISVANAGEKISDSAKKFLFQPFYREKANQGKQGLGLGLYIASEIAKAHKGDLKVSSTEKQTCFTFEMLH